MKQLDGYRPGIGHRLASNHPATIVILLAVNRMEGAFSQLEAVFVANSGDERVVLHISQQIPPDVYSFLLA